MSHGHRRAGARIPGACSQRAGTWLHLVAAGVSILVFMAYLIHDDQRPAAEAR
jgi:hypothetical protein